jgi:triosephosphate isomerase
MNRKYRKTVIAGNWKMNMLASEIKPFMEELRAAMPSPRACDVVLCTPAVMIPTMVKAGKEAKVAAGGQDVSKFDKGAYTGEVSASQLQDIGAKYCIVGHSERRQYHGEDDMLVNAKAKALLAKGIMPIICVGESLEQREMDLTMEYVAYQVKAALSGIDATQLRRCIIAYEGDRHRQDRYRRAGAGSLREHPCRYPRHLRRPSGTRRLHPLRRQHERKECGRAACTARHRRRPHRRRISQARRLRHHHRGNQPGIIEAQ